jgi:anti-sigma factor RsiW
MLERLKRMARLQSPWVQNIRTPHPSFADLLAYHDEELEAARRALIAAHLPDCARCRGGLAGIKQSLDRSPALTSPSMVVPSAEECLQRILEVALDEGRLAAEQARVHADLNQRGSVALAKFFGSYPEFLRRTASADPVSRAEIARLAQLFLGQRAALALLHRIDVEAGLA